MILWAVLFHGVGAFKSFEQALYFSGVTFTSLGYGDLVLPRDARLLAPLEAATGLMMFGITTAMFIAALRKVRFKGIGGDTFNAAFGDPEDD